MKNFPLLLLMLLTATALHAENTFFKNTGDILGQVQDAEGQAVIYANVGLYQPSDSSLVKVELTDESGFFAFRQISAGTYYLEISYIGMAPYRSGLITLEAGQSLKLPLITLQAAATDLAEVEVTAQRPLLEVKPDKLVMNVQGSINATGNDAMELLRQAPGVVVDQNDNISLMGKSNVRIFINGRPTRLSGEDLVALLESMQADEIDAIEIITNPSARYEAEGSAGIINIRLVSQQKKGGNLHFNAGYSRGMFDRYNASVSGNFRDKKVNLFGSYGYRDGQRWFFHDFYRTQNNLFFDQYSSREGRRLNHNFQTGMDYYLNKKQTLGFLIQGNLQTSDGISTSTTEMGNLSTGQTDSLLLAQNISDGFRNNYLFNINYTFNKNKNTSWHFNADYAFFRSNRNQQQPNDYYTADGDSLLQSYLYYTHSPTDIDIYTFKADHERPAFSGTLGSGIKLTRVITDNLFEFYNTGEANPNLLDTTRSNQFQYIEDVLAAYVTFNKEIGKWRLDLGLRAEQTHTLGELTPFTSSQTVDPVERNYLNFFPSLGIGLQLTPKHNMQLSYSRRINRPNYQDLNPFEFKMDELTFRKGNPFLNPEYTHSVQLTHTYNYALNTSIGYSHTTGLITRLSDTTGVKGSFLSYYNLATQDNYNFNISGNIPITEWWSTYTNFSAFHLRNHANFGEGKIVDVAVTSFSVFSQHVFRLPANFSIELSGRYSAPSIWGGNFYTRAFWGINAGIQKKFAADRGQVKLSLNDIFLSQRWQGQSELGVLTMQSRGGWDSRRLSLSLSYRIGQAAKGRGRNNTRKTGLEDELKRTGGGDE